MCPMTSFSPFAGGISVVALLLIDAAQQIQCCFQLLLKKLENVSTGNFAVIGDLILGQFLFLWSFDCLCFHTTCFIGADLDLDAVMIEVLISSIYYSINM